MIDVDKVDELLADTYLLLLASKDEGIPLVMCEAMLMKVPVICTDVGAINEVITDKFNGCLVGPGQYDDVVQLFTNTVFDFMTGKLNYSEIAERARDTITSGYSMSVMMEGYRALFQELLISSNNKELDTIRQPMSIKE